jgi:hypothetical protein
MVKGFPSIPVKKPSRIVKIMLERLGMNQDVEMVNDSASAEIEEMFAQSLVPGMSSLPLTAMREWMLNHDPLAQFVAGLWTYRNRA